MPVCLPVTSCKLEWVQYVAVGDPGPAGLGSWYWLHTGNSGLNIFYIVSGVLGFHSANHRLTVATLVTGDPQLAPTASTTSICLHAMEFVNSTALYST